MEDGILSFVDVYVVLVIVAMLVTGLGVHYPEFMKFGWYHGLCVLAFGYEAWFALSYVQRLEWMPEYAKWIVFAIGIFLAFVTLMKVLRLLVVKDRPA